MQVTHGIRIIKNMKFHKATISKLRVKKKLSLNTFKTKQDTIAKISQKKTAFLKNVLHK